MKRREEVTIEKGADTVGNYIVVVAEPVALK